MSIRDISPLSAPLYPHWESERRVHRFWYKVLVFEQQGIHPISCIMEAVLRLSVEGEIEIQRVVFTQKPPSVLFLQRESLKGQIRFNSEFNRIIGIIAITIWHYFSFNIWLSFELLVLKTVWNYLEIIWTGWGCFMKSYWPQNILTVKKSESCLPFSSASNNFSPKMSISNCHKLPHLIKPNTTWFWIWLFFLFRCFTEEGKVNWWGQKLHFAGASHPLSPSI